jgi:sugar fermentation stimulation protein A
LTAPRASIPFPPLLEGALVRRRRRFLADVRLESGEDVTAHTSNTGRMLACSEPGRKVYLSDSKNPERRYPLTWELIDMGPSLVGINTLLPNKLAALAFRAGSVPGFPGPSEVRAEVRAGDSRLDLLVKGGGGGLAYVEVKNCTFVEDGFALFPDAVSRRAARHLDELMRLVKAGHRGVILVMVSRSDALRFAPADSIDPAWGAMLRKAVKAGVELMAHEAVLSPREAVFGKALPCVLDGPKRPLRAHT